MQTELLEDAVYTYCFLTEWEFDVGIIGISEYEERADVLDWLINYPHRATSTDPRGEAETNEDSSFPIEPLPEGNTGQGDNNQRRPDEEENPSRELIPIGLRQRWAFTKNDADCYPSVPHGHLNEKTNAWPKLNPYTGQAFSKKDSEDMYYRLKKQEMIILWNDDKFRLHALETIAWYSTINPCYRFPVSNPLRLPRKRR